MAEDATTGPVTYRRLDNYVGAGWRSRRQKAAFVWGMILFWIVDHITTSFVHDWKTRILAAVVQFLLVYLIFSRVLRRIDQLDRQEAESHSEPPTAP